MGAKRVIGDDLLLTMVRLRAGGWSAARIAQFLGQPELRVRVAVNRVRGADLAELGEPEKDVLAHYWPDGRRRHV